MPQSGVSVSPGRTYRGDEGPDAGDGRRRSERRSESPRPVRAIPARLASMADVTAELDFTPRPRARRTSGPISPRAAVTSTATEPVRPFGFESPADAETEPAGPLATAVAGPSAPGSGVAGRRTVTIHGRPAERYSSTAQRRRPTRRPHERDGFRPDRVAMWAVMLGFVLVLVAATSSHAATITHRTASAQRHVVRVHHAARVHASARAVELRAGAR
jgi:hypothetical protein